MLPKKAKPTELLSEFEDLAIKPNGKPIARIQREQEPNPVIPASDTSLIVLRALVWFGCCIWVGLVLLHWLSKAATEDSAIRDAASSASACLGIVAAYVICRAFDSATRR